MTARYRKAVQEWLPFMMKRHARVYLAKSGTYGFFTNEAGDRVVSFQYDVRGLTLSGNYIPDQGSTTGTGWQITEMASPGDVIDAITISPPRWAVGNSNWRYTTEQEYLDRYQKSSDFGLVKHPETESHLEQAGMNQLGGMSGE